MVLIIGLVGTKGVGKTTIAQHLLTSGFTEVSFADTLKESLCTLLGLERNRFDDPVLKERSSGSSSGALAEVYTMTPREMMQKYGDLVKQLFGPQVFINSVHRRLRHIQTPVVISDIRFPAEADFVCSLGARLYRVVRGTHSRVLDGDGACCPLEQVPSDRHPSESLQWSITCHATICNTGLSLVDLYTAVDTEIHSLQEPLVLGNRCVQCGTDLGSCNPRQLCGKTVCDNEPSLVDFS